MRSETEFNELERSLNYIQPVQILVSLYLWISDSRFEPVGDFAPIHKIWSQLNKFKAKIFFFSILKNKFWKSELGLSPYSVSLEWIVESMKRGQKVSESSYPFPPTEIKVRFVFFHLPGTDLDNAWDPFHFDVSLSKSVL